MLLSRLVPFAGLLLLGAACNKTQGERARAVVRDPGPPVAPPASRPAAAVSPVPAAGADFSVQAQRIYRVTTCGGVRTSSWVDSLPAREEKLVAAHCSSMRAYLKRHNKHLGAARSFLAALRPAVLPRVVVYPFGGGDLLFALTTFPDAREITTISLERSGDPRGVDLPPSHERLREGLAEALWLYMRLASVDYNFTAHMFELESRMLPAQLTLALAALWTHGHVPVALRYFRIEPDGSLRYVTHAEVARSDAEARTAPVVKRRRHGRRDRRGGRVPSAPEVFANMELTYRPVGAPRGEPPRIYRHVEANLDDPHLASTGLLRHLEAKGQVAAMTKAAGYLLWLDRFSRIRGYLLAHMVWMISDSTGILPRHAKAAGFVQTTYGRFRRSLLDTSDEHNQEMRDLWRSQPHRELPFSYGYPDYDSSAHLLLTRRGGTP